MAPVAGKPVLQHIFDLVARAGVEEIHVNVHYLADAILRLYGTEAQVNGAKVDFTREERLTGTAGGVKRLASGGAFEETFVVIMGDALTDVDLRELVAFHEEKGVIATLALKHVGDTSEYGVAELDGQKNILRFQEKPEPREAKSNLANTGIYVLEPEVLGYIPEVPSSTSRRMSSRGFLDPERRSWVTTRGDSTGRTSARSSPTGRPSVTRSREGWRSRCRASGAVVGCGYRTKPESTRPPTASWRATPLSAPRPWSAVGRASPGS